MATDSLSSAPRAACLSIGDELLIGQTLNTHAAYLGRWLNRAGVPLVEVRTVRDDRYEIVAAIRALLERVDWLIVTGGLGPTKDDITKEAIAECFGRKLVVDEGLIDQINRLYTQMGFKDRPEPMSRLYYIPEGAAIYYNEQGTAPALQIEEEGKLILAFPGVPGEFHHLWEDKVWPELIAKWDVESILQTTILTVGIGEPLVEKTIEGLRSELPCGLSLAYLPHYSIVKVRLTLPPTSDRAEGRKVLASAASRIEEALYPYSYGWEGQSLAEVVGTCLAERNVYIGTAESCTGGYIAHTMTSHPGSSAYFKGAIVSYANSVKRDLLGVTEDSLQQWGAVSEAVAREMAEGAVKALGVDLAISTTGIAGPDGGSDEKPVGTVWIALSDGRQTHTKKYWFPYDRQGNIEATAIRAMDMARRFLMGQRII